MKIEDGHEPPPVMVGVTAAGTRHPPGGLVPQCSSDRDSERHEPLWWFSLVARPSDRGPVAAPSLPDSAGGL